MFIRVNLYAIITFIEKISCRKQNLQIFLHLAQEFSAFLNEIVITAEIMEEAIELLDVTEMDNLPKRSNGLPDICQAEPKSRAICQAEPGKEKALDLIKLINANGGKIPEFDY